LVAKTTKDRVIVFNSIDAHVEFVMKRQSGVFKDHPLLIGQYVACVVDSGTPATITVEGRLVHDILVTGGRHKGCKGSIPIEDYQPGKPAKPVAVDPDADLKRRLQFLQVANGPKHGLHSHPFVKRVTRAQFGSKWPLSVDEAVLVCFPGVGRGSHTIVIGDQPFAVNEAAAAFVSTYDVQLLVGDDLRRVQPARNPSPLIPNPAGLQEHFDPILREESQCKSVGLE
jgi:hypothetical protein